MGRAWEKSEEITSAWGVCLGGQGGRMGHENGDFPYHGFWGRGSEDQTLEAGGAPQEGRRRVQSGHYWGSWFGDCEPVRREAPPSPKPILKLAGSGLGSPH